MSKEWGQETRSRQIGRELGLPFLCKGVREAVLKVWVRE